MEALEPSACGMTDAEVRTKSYAARAADVIYDTHVCTVLSGKTCRLWPGLAGEASGTAGQQATASCRHAH